MKKEWKLILPILMLAMHGFGSARSFAQTNPAEDLFKSKCSTCHGPDGAGKTTMGAMLKIRDLRSDDVQKQTDADLNRIITKEKNKMPSFDGKVKKEQVDQLVAYIRQLGEN